VTAALKKNSELQTLLDEMKEKLNISVANSTFEYNLKNVSGLFNSVCQQLNIILFPMRSFVKYYGCSTVFYD